MKFINRNKRIIIVAIILVVIIFIGILFGNYVYYNSYNKTDNLVINVSKNIINNDKPIGNVEFISYLIKNEQDLKKHLVISNNKIDFSNHDYLLIRIPFNYCGGKMDEVSVNSLSKNKIVINQKFEGSCGVCFDGIYSYLIELEKNILIDDYNIEINKIDTNSFRHCHTVDKPIIYLYPSHDMNVELKLENEKLLKTTYPLYENGWNVFAKTNGDLYDLKTNRKYYGLYWEAYRNFDLEIKDEGFVVKNDQLIPFFESMLSKLGLNEKEANEFIVYWLPILQENEYNYIYFENIEEINKHMPLNINPMPDSIIRIMMEYKKIDTPINVKPQKIITPKRDGFTVVEWGGTEI